MKVIKSCIFVLTCALLMLTLSTQAKDNVEILGSLPFVENIRISPDGSKIAYLQNVDGIYHIVTKPLGKSTTLPTAFSLDKAKIREFEWGSDNRILFYSTIPYYSRADYETFTMSRLGILKVDSNEVIWTFNKGKNARNIGAPGIVNQLINKPNHMLLAYGDEVTMVDLTDGDKEEYFNKWQSDNMKSDIDGQQIMHRHWDPKYENYYWNYKLPEEDEYRRLKVLKEEKPVDFQANILRMGETNTSFYFYTDNEADFSLLMKADVENDLVTNIQQISPSTGFDVDHIIYDPHSSQVIGYSVIKDFPEYFYIDKTMAAVQADLVATFPDTEVEITSYSKDRNRFIVKLSSSEFPLEYYFYDIKAGQLAKVTAAYPELDAKTLGKTKKIEYKGEDDINIVSYLTLPNKPAAKAGKKPALIVIPHGGPWARDSMSFDWMRQFYATQGFAVFQPNFRGSTGYGKKFTDAGNGEWGKKMQTDIDIGVKKLIDDGLVDADRICVVGSSYGGYVAMFSATSRVETYKCSVSFAGLSDIDDLFFHAEQQTGFSEQYKEAVGDRRDQEALRKSSPLFLISEKTRPLLLLHGDKDTRVPSFQSKNMFKYLKKAKIAGIQYIELEDEDHWLSLGTSRKILLKESLKFIHKNID